MVAEIPADLDAMPLFQFLAEWVNRRVGPRPENRPVPCVHEMHLKIGFTVLGGLGGDQVDLDVGEHFGNLAGHSEGFQFSQ